MSASEQHKKTLQGYTSLPPSDKVSLSSYCRDHGVNYRAFRYWMQKKGISFPKSNRQVKPHSDSPLAPLTILPPGSPAGLSAGPSCPSPVSVMKGVKIALPNGVQVSIREISGTAMTGIIHSLNLR